MGSQEQNQNRNLKECEILRQKREKHSYQVERSGKVTLHGNSSHLSGVLFLELSRLGPCRLGEVVG